MNYVLVLIVSMHTGGISSLQVPFSDKQSCEQTLQSIVSKQGGSWDYQYSVRYAQCHSIKSEK